MTRPVRIEGELVTDRGLVDLDEEDYRLADGTRLTEAKAEELADEILTRTGRPSLTEPGVRSPQVRFSVPAEVKERLRERAEAEHRTTSAVAREALERYLAS